ncbi:uncharacterized protein LOC113313099 [Papaver somniferum]|uniref:uncharacterized protein LOC113313099 n=1 Tax=Papaver somniferum TaxID=3469 RepID=UPI000E6F9D6E|nr:uncharacterized protein LOC113313099 [Papaver somniferum]
MKVSELITNDECQIPLEMNAYFNEDDLLYIGNGVDRRIWETSLTGDFSVANAVQDIRKKFPKCSWAKKIWRSCIHPNLACNMWKIVRGVVATEDSVRKKGFSIVSKCYICCNGQDTLTHLLWECSFSKKIWHWLGGIFKILNPSNFDEVLNSVQSKSPAVNEIWYIAVYTLMVEIWLTRNKKLYEDVTPNTENGIKSKTTRIKEIHLSLPEHNQIPICRDGAAKGNPGVAGFGFIGRNSDSECVGAMAGGLGIATNFVAEMMALVMAGEWAVSKSFLNVLFSLYSHAVLNAFTGNIIPWMILNRWKKVISHMRRVSIRHVYREANFSADKIAKKGATLSRGEIVRYENKPSFIGRLEDENIRYFRFY